MTILMFHWAFWLPVELQETCKSNFGEVTEPLPQLEGVLVLAGVDVMVFVGVWVAELVGVGVLVPGGKVLVMVLVGVFVGETVGVMVGVFVGVLVAVLPIVGVMVGVLVMVFVGQTIVMAAVAETAELFQETDAVLGLTAQYSVLST